MAMGQVFRSLAGSEQKQRTLVPVLTVVVICQLALYAGLRLPAVLAEKGWRPPADAAATRITRWRRQLGREENDPQLGMGLPALNLQKLHGGTLDLTRFGGRPLALLMVGDGEGCSTKSLMSAWAKLQEDHPDMKVVAVADAKSDGLDTLCRGGKLHLQVAIDADHALVELLNARWKPRAYLFDRGGTLRYVQPDTTMNPQALDATTRLLARLTPPAPQQQVVLR